MNIELNFSKKSPKLQLLYFCFIVSISFFITALLAIIVFSFNTDNLKIYLLLSQITMFLLPALFFGYYYSEKSWVHNLSLSKPSTKNILIAVGLLIIALPIIDAITYLNYQIKFPWEQTNAYLKAEENTQTNVLENILTFKTPQDFIFTLFLTGITPAICEELFFRSVLNKIIYRISKNTWYSIIITAIIFAAIHFHFNAFFPRFFLGIILSFLLFYTNSVYPSIILHALFNSLQVISIYIMGNDYLKKNLKTVSLSFPVYIIIIATVGFILFMYYLLKKKNIKYNA